MSDADPAAAAAETPPAPRKGKPGLVLIGALVGGLVVGVAAGLFGVGPLVARSSGYVVTDEMTASLNAQAKRQAAAAGHEVDEEGAAEGEGHEGAKDGADGGEHAAEGEGGGTGPANLHLVDNLVLNPAGSGGTRFLMLSAAIEFRDAALVEQFKGRDAEVRDLVLRVMGAKTVEQLSEMATREIIRKEVMDSLAGLLPKKERKKAISRLFFPQFVIQ